MDKQTFLDTLKLKLAELGINEAAINNQINQFEHYFKILPAEEVEKQLNNINDISAIAQNICSLLKESANSNDIDSATSENSVQPQLTPDVEANAPVSESVGTKATEADVSSFKAPPTTPEAYIPKTDHTDSIYIEGNEYTAEQNIPLRKQTNANYYPSTHKYSDESYSHDTRYGRQNTSTVPLIDINSIDYDHEFDGDRYYSTERMTSKQKRKNVKGSPMFWALCILTFPIYGAVLLMMYVLFFVLFAVLAISIFASILLLAAVVIAGTGLSLYGIIYGIIQTFTVFSPGLFEIGLGITIGGITMLAGILIYNFAVRLLPFVMKMLFQLLRLTNEKLAELFYYIKKECSR